VGTKEENKKFLDCFNSLLDKYYWIKKSA
jgi:hypothetical protein